MGHQIPLVMYNSGVRTVLGMCSVAPDGAIAGQVSKEHWKLFKPRFEAGVGELSINPAVVPKVHPGTPEVLITTTKVQE